MRKILLLLAVVMLVACGSREDQAVRRAVERQMKDFPATSLLDLYKSFFQDNFGPGHIVSDTASARAYILYELEQADSYDNHYYEPVGVGENFYRVSLATIADSIVPLDVYCNAFYASVKDVQAVDVEQWKQQWTEILRVIEGMNLNLPNFERDKASLDSVLSVGGYAFHHSRRYNQLYHPHYRLIKKEIFFNEIKPLIDSTRVY